jgi:hypothetical protein
LSSATASSLTGISDISGWTVTYTCGLEGHTHNAECYVKNGQIKDNYTFKFKIAAQGSSWSEIAELTVSRAEILACVTNKTPYKRDGFFTIPVAQIDNGPFTVTEIDSPPGWSTVESAGIIYLETYYKVADTVHKRTGEQEGQSVVSWKRRRAVLKA